MQPCSPPFRSSPVRLIAQYLSGRLKNAPIVALSEEALDVIRMRSSS